MFVEKSWNSEEQEDDESSGDKDTNGASTTSSMVVNINSVGDVPASRFVSGGLYFIESKRRVHTTNKTTPSSKKVRSSTDVVPVVVAPMDTTSQDEIMDVAPQHVVPTDHSNFFPLP